LISSNYNLLNISLIYIFAYKIGIHPFPQSSYKICLYIICLYILIIHGIPPLESTGKEKKRNIYIYIYIYTHIYIYIYIWKYTLPNSRNKIGVFLLWDKSKKPFPSSFSLSRHVESAIPTPSTSAHEGRRCYVNLGERTTLIGFTFKAVLLSRHNCLDFCLDNLLYC